ncbi:GDSL-like lipase/acylhydrolase family protein [Tamaricihabitans halophyticus]|uniref:GDSL-like lipase/acylhydrolase family protein n=1 Tax=Tamaricihabitans halophyticus TaxID=1262583 RepID=A0A4V2STJ4_9PSEU|nr:GDSL-like lipase/acylhydrolase family protein [Tamaricihabitans halophyticus]
MLGAAIVVLLVGVVILVVEVSRQDEPQPGPPENAERVVVALGDSTMSGEGAGDYTNRTNGRNGNWCHRSPNASIESVDIPGVDRAINLACSGAPSEQVGLGETKQYTEESQAARLGELAKKYRVVAVAVATGANDEPKFSHLVNQCVQAWANQRGDGCSKQIRQDWQGRIDAMQPKVVSALQDVQQVMSDANYDEDDYDLVLQSYAAPLSPDIPNSLQGLVGCPFRTEDLRWVRDEAMPALTAALREAAEETDTRFLDLSRSARGNEACSGGADDSTEWFTRLTVQWEDLNDEERVQHVLQESFHPNARGAAQFGRCLSDFLNNTDDQAACLKDQKGQLRAVATIGAD